MIRPVVRSVVGSVVRKVTGETQVKRYITEFLSSAQSFGQFSNSISLDDGFSITITTASITGTFGRLLGNQSSFDNQIRMNSDDASVLVRASGGTEHTINFDSAITRSQLNTIRVYRADGSSTINIDVNGVTQASTATESGVFVFDTINVSFGVYGTGPLLDLKIDKSGTLIHSYPMDEDPTATEFVDGVGSNNITKQNIDASQTVLYDQVSDGWTGPELWTFGNSVSNGSEGAFNNINAGGIALTIGNVYRTSLASSGFTVGSQQFRYGSTSGGQITTNGFFTEDQQATISTNIRTRVGSVQCNSGSTLSNISVKRFLEVV